MARPKPARERTPITVRVDPDVATRILELVEASNEAPDLTRKLSLNEWCAAVLGDAAQRGVTITVSQHYEITYPS